MPSLNFDLTKPADTDAQNVFPTLNRADKVKIENFVDTEHNKATGKHSGISLPDGQDCDTQAVTGSASSVAVTFGSARGDTNYKIIALPNWNTTVWYSSIATTGFTLNFGTTSGSTQAVFWVAIDQG